MAEPHLEGIGLFRRQRVLHPLRLLVPLRRRNARSVGEVALPQAVRAHQADGGARALAGQRRAIRLHPDQAHAREARQQGRRARRGEPQAAGHAVDRAPLPGLPARQDVLEGVFQEHPLAELRHAQPAGHQAAPRPCEGGQGDAQAGEDQERQSRIYHVSTSTL